MSLAPDISFKPGISWLLVAASLLVVVLAVVAIDLSGVTGWQRGLWLGVLCACVAACSRWALRPRIAALTWRGDGSVHLALRGTALADAATAEGTVSAARVMGPLIVLSLRWPVRERAHLWLLPDNLDAQTRRHLRMRIGSGVTASGNADSP